MKKVKIGKGYYQSGYGRGWKSAPVVWRINNYLYAKDAKNWDTDHQPLEGELKGYVRVNTLPPYEGKFYQCGPREHIPYESL